MAGRGKKSGRRKHKLHSDVQQTCTEMPIYNALPFVRSLLFTTVYLHVNL